MKIYVLSITLFFLAISCSEPVDSESMDFEDFAGETGIEEVDSVIQEVELAFDINTNSGKLRNSLASLYESDSTDEFHVMNRYSFNNKEQYKFTFLEQVPYGDNIMLNPTADFFYYSFKDTNATYNAFYNYLDGLASDGEGRPIKLNEDVSAIKSPPLFMAVYDTMIISAEYMCEHKAHDWDDFQDSIFSIYGKKYKYMIEIDCGGPLEWK
ncbi:MAG: hypothetical protein ACI857_000847 [Arenicella sp.]|jgi:hypothetical protein